VAIRCQFRDHLTTCAAGRARLGISGVDDQSDDCDGRSQRTDRRCDRASFGAHC
jgi:hypothetical protein